MSDIGKVAKSKAGIIGIIQNKKGEVYFGFTLNNKSWQAISPEILADSIYDYIIYMLGGEDINMDEDRNVGTLDFIRIIKEGTPKCRIKAKM